MSGFEVSDKSTKYVFYLDRLRIKTGSEMNAVVKNSFRFPLFAALVFLNSACGPKAKPTAISPPKNSAFVTDLLFEKEITMPVKDALKEIMTARNADGFFISSPNDRMLASLLLDRFSYLPALAISHADSAVLELKQDSVVLSLEVVNSAKDPPNHVHFAFRSLDGQRLNGKFFHAEEKLAEYIKRNAGNQVKEK
jgi:hypothetical protein